MTNVLSERRPQQFQQWRQTLRPSKQPCNWAAGRQHDDEAKDDDDAREAVPEAEAEGLKRGFDFNGAHMCCQRQQLSYIMDIKCWPWEHGVKWAWPGACAGHNNSSVRMEGAIKALKSRRLEVDNVTNDISIGRWIKSHLQRIQNTEGNR